MVGFYHELLAKQECVEPLTPVDNSKHLTLDVCVSAFRVVPRSLQFSQVPSHPSHKSRQTADESVDEFVARLRVLAAKCKFADVGETHVRLIEQIIVGTKHVAVQEKLLEKGDSLSSLDAALDIARTYEATKSHLAQLQSTSSSTVHGVQKQQSSASASTNCTRCGLDHSTTATCPAKGATCLNCGKPNHWAQSVQSQTWSKGPSTRQISTRSTTREQQAEGKTATAQSPVKG